MGDFFFWLGIFAAFVSNAFFFHSWGKVKGYTEFDWFVDKETEAYKKLLADKDKEIKLWTQDFLDDIQKKSAEIGSLKADYNKLVSELEVTKEELDNRVRLHETLKSTVHDIVERNNKWRKAAVEIRSALEGVGYE